MLITFTYLRLCVVRYTFLMAALVNGLATA